MTLQQIADRLARVALAHCAHDSDPDLDEWSKHDLGKLTAKFVAELRPYWNTKVASTKGQNDGTITSNVAGILRQAGWKLAE